MQQSYIEVEQAGQVIRGTTYRPDGLQRGPAVLLLHGFTGQRIEAGFLFVTLGRLLAQRGIAAVTFDFRHSGESDGSFDQMLVTGELADALRMTTWLQSQPFADRTRLGLLGFSLGGLLAAACMARTDAYRALTLLAPTTVANICRFAGEQAADAPVTVGCHQLHRDFFRDVKTLNPVADVIRNPRPTLLVQGTEDQAVTPAVSQAYVAALQRTQVPCEHALIAGADHGFGKPTHRQQLCQTVVDFFARQLGR